MVGRRRKPASTGSAKKAKKTRSSSPAREPELPAPREEPIEADRLADLLEQRRRMDEEIEGLLRAGAPTQPGAGASAQTGAGASSSGAETTQDPTEPLPLRESYLVSRSIDREPDWKQLALDLLEQRGHVFEHFPIQSTSPLERPIFSGRFSDDPPKFLEKFESFYSKVQHRNSNKLAEAIQCLSGRTEEWATANQAHWLDFTDFKEAFLAFFWSKSRRQQIQMDLLSIPYDPKQTLSMVDFFLKQFNRMNTLMLPMSEEDVVATVMRLMPREIQSVWSLISPRDRTAIRAQEFLAEQSQLEGRVKTPFSRAYSQKQQHNLSSKPHVPALAASSNGSFNPFSMPPPTA